MPKKSSEEYDLVSPQVTPVFIKNMECKSPVIVNRGGAGSSKTHSLSQYFIYKFLTEQNKKILIVRKALPSLRLSVQTYLERVFDDFGVRNRIKEEKVMMNYRFGTNLIHLGSVDDPQKIKCHSEDTEILTKEGFKLIKDTKVGDLVASMNPETRELIYTPITNYYEYEYKGKMIRPRSTKIDFCVTPNHKMLINKKGKLVFIEANLLQNNYLMPVNKKTDIVVKENIQIDYDGKIYCVETKPYHTTLTRYNGKIAWTGNSSEWNYAWMEEATEFKYEDFQLIRSYTRAPTFDGHPNQVILSFNPIDESHWIKTELLDKHEDVTEIRSTYKDNPFLPDEAIKFYENSINYDINFYRIYALGEWGKLEDLIYNPNSWDTCKELPDIPSDIYGLDFGFNSPSALTHGVYKEREIWEELLLYKTGLTNSQLIEELKKIIPENKRNRPIYADSAEPDRIKEIRQAGFNCRQALKDIKDGIDFVKRMRIHIVESSLEMIKEKRSYSYKKDTKRNLILDEPIPFNDHCYDKETEILTYEGWKYFKDLTENDLVMSLNDKKESIYIKPIRIIKQMYEGEMFNYSGNKLNFCITPDQLLWAANQYSCKVKKEPEFNFISINNLPHTSWIKNTCFSWKGGDSLKNIEFRKLTGKYFGNYNIDIINFSKFLGLFLAEGCTNRSHYAIIIDGKGEDIKNIVEGIKIPYHKDISKQGVDRYYIFSKELYPFFKSLGKAKNKHIPIEFKQGNKEILQALWEGYEVGDGYKTGKNKGASSISYKLLSDFQEILFKLGFSTNLYKIKKEGKQFILGRLCDVNNCYRLIIPKENKGTTGLGFIELRKDKIFKTFYNDFVYDVEVPSNIIAVRRKGKIMWSSNCMDSERYMIFTHLHNVATYRVRWI